MTHGWQRQSDRSLWAALDDYSASNLKHVLCTDVGRDGALTGPNGHLYQEAVRRYPHIEWQASGGIPAAPLTCTSWTRTGGSQCGHQRQGAARGPDLTRGAAAILAKRIIACLDVRDGKVVKGIRFRDHRVVGGILDLAARYRDDGADELVFYDISASLEGTLRGSKLGFPRRAGPGHPVLRCGRNPVGTRG